MSTANVQEERRSGEDKSREQEKRWGEDGRGETRRKGRTKRVHVLH